jgi:endonuclease/exonuclease/phosphatase family metal-dependent hydrolase
MKTSILKILLPSILLYLAVETQALVQPRGTEDTFDIATWNIKEFPQRGQRTIDTLAILIQDLQLDLIAIEEISDTLAFMNLLSQLPGWDGFYSPDITTPTYQKTGIIYRTDQISILSWEPIFWNDGWEFPRPPLRITVVADLPSGTFDFYLIVMHLKAFDDDQSRARRMAAMGLLKDYLDEIVPFLPDHDWLVVGDYNDELTDPQDENIFWDFLQDSTDYSFLTLPLAGNPYWASYPYYNSLIDHIMATEDALGEYGPEGETITLRLDDEYSNYSYVISDHRPVMSKFTSLATGIDDDPELPDDFGLTAYPNPFNAAANIAFSLTEPSDARIDIYDCLGRHIRTLIDSHLQTGSYTVQFDGSDMSSGVYFLKLTTDTGHRVEKLNLLK